MQDRHPEFIMDIMTAAAQCIQSFLLFAIPTFLFGMTGGSLPWLCRFMIHRFNCRPILSPIECR
jgi:hypothetical protein